MHTANVCNLRALGRLMLDASPRVMRVQKARQKIGVRVSLRKSQRR